MDAKQFYVTSGNNAASLIFVTANTLKTLKLDDASELRLKADNFQAKLGDLSVVFNDKGQVLKAYIGQESGTEAQALALIVLRLPPAVYKAESTLSFESILAFATSQYRFDKYKKNNTPIRQLLIKDAELSDALIDLEAIFLVRDLINTPTNDLGPIAMEAVAKSMAKTYKAKFNSIKGEHLLEEGFPAIHAVGRAAKQLPRLLSINYGKREHPHVILVGKGVCFDSGGLDIKPSSGMRLMKKDMGGAAHVLGLAQWIMAKKLPIHLTVLIPAVENAISGNAYRPGDVLTMRNGMSVEIDNTDAEGRLVLADAITYACEQNPDLLIDYATLTGAARVAVGTDIAAMFTNHDELSRALEDCAKKTEEAVWRMPLYKPYNSLFDSTIADMMNSSASPYAGAIVAALFLQRFVTSPCPWVHFDIMAWNVGNRPGKPEGGEAMAFRTVAQYLTQFICKSRA